MSFQTINNAKMPIRAVKPMTGGNVTIVQGTAVSGAPPAPGD
jgi:hypothetical protein